MWKYALAAFLLLTGLAMATNVRFELMGVITGLSAIVAAVLLLLNR